MISLKNILENIFDVTDSDYLKSPELMWDLYLDGISIRQGGYGPQSIGEYRKNIEPYLESYCTEGKEIGKSTVKNRSKYPYVAAIFHLEDRTRVSIHLFGPDSRIIITTGFIKFEPDNTRPLREVAGWKCVGCYVFPEKTYNRIVEGYKRIVKRNK